MKERKNDGIYLERDSAEPLVVRLQTSDQDGEIGGPTDVIGPQVIWVLANILLHSTCSHVQLLYMVMVMTILQAK